MHADKPEACPDPTELAEILAKTSGAERSSSTPNGLGLSEHLDHWLQGCPRCRRTLREVQHWQREVAHPDPRVAAREYPHLLELWKRLEGLTPRQLIAQLEDVELRDRVDSCRWALAQRLLQQSELTVGFDAERASEFAEAALALIVLLPLEYGELALRELEIRALASAGNALRVASRLQDSRRYFDQATRRLEARPAVSLLTQARVADLLGSLLRDMRDLDEAEQVWLRAVVLYLNADDRSMAGKVQLNLGNVAELKRDWQRGMRYLRKAQSLLDPESEPVLYGICHQHLLYFCAEVDLLDEAEILLPRVRRLWSRMRHQHNLALTHWVEARIRQARGDTQEAERIFRALIHGFEANQRPWEAALLRLDLAALTAQQGDLRRARELASMACTTLRHLHVPSQVALALVALIEIVQAEEMTAQLLGAGVKHLQRIVRGCRDPFAL